MIKVTKILCVGGVPFDSSVAGMIIDCVEDIETAVARMRSTNIDAVVLSFDSVSDTHADILRKFRQVAVRTVPIVVLGCIVPIATIVDFMHAGASDYLIKDDTDVQSFGVAIYKAIERCRINNDWGKVVDNAFDQALRDPLTALPNRKYFNDVLTQALASAKRDTTPVAVLFIDINKFKEINDNFGHDVGDQCLIDVSQRLSESLRKWDVIARYGGDEFVIMLKNLKQPEDAYLVASRLTDTLKEPFIFYENRIELDASVGVSLYPQDGSDAAELIKRADDVMFKAKKTGVLFMQAQLSYENTSRPAGAGTRLPLEKSNKVLIVDDDDDLQVMLKKRLNSVGLTCVACKSVEEALTSLKDVRPSVVVLDLGFKSASGIAFLQNMPRYLAEDQERPAVLVLSGYGDAEIINYAKILGADSFVTKPFDSAGFVETLQAYFH